jgi:hypothetical protein
MAKPHGLRRDWRLTWAKRWFILAESAGFGRHFAPGMSEIDKPGDNRIVADRVRKRCIVRQLEREMAINPKPKLSSSKCGRRCTAAPTR